MKNAMQELIEMHNSRIYPTDLHVWITQNKERLLEKEKEHIIVAYLNGYYEGFNHTNYSADQYYNKIYSQDSQINQK